VAGAEFIIVLSIQGRTAPVTFETVCRPELDTTSINYSDTLSSFVLKLYIEYSIFAVCLPGTKLTDLDVFLLDRSCIRSIISITPWIDL
jgi:hypothetical protein